MDKNFQIAIDGPCAVGKTTIAKKIAEKLSFLLINTGNMYRCYALVLIQKKTNLENETEILDVLNSSKVDLDNGEWYVNGINVTEQLLDQEIATIASKIATIKKVREKCVNDQRKIALSKNCVMEGRDIGTVVLPNATLKVYLDGDIDLRAKRRWKQLNCNKPLLTIKNEIIERDYQDTHREFSPLVKSKEAFVIYDNGLSIDEVSNMIIDKFKEKINAA